MKRSFLKTGVTLKTSDAGLQTLFDKAEQGAKHNISRDYFTRVMVEGGGYDSCWIETQPMAGGMYAKRDVEIALNNQLIYIDCQNAEGKLPYRVDKDGSCVYHKLQGYCFPDSAWKVYFFLNKDRGYLRRLYKALAGHDRWLWKNRKSSSGVLLSEGPEDSGEDRTTRFDGHGGPYESMDVMGYSFDGRHVLSLISKELRNGKSAFWRLKARQVRNKLKKRLWREEKRACQDRDSAGRFIECLVHNNLRAMHHGVFTQAMADAFIRHHLLNPREFWTPIPLPSIAVNDSKFVNDPHNHWGGQPQGLTFQRSIRALENYGHFAEVGLIGEKFLANVTWHNDIFSQQYDPFTGQPGRGKGYGPSILAALEFISHMHGVEPALERSEIWFSGLPRNEHSIRYTQRIGNRRYTLQQRDGKFTGFLNGRRKFACTSGVRVVTDLKGNVVYLVGIDRVAREGILAVGRQKMPFKISPNQVLKRTDRGLKLQSAAPFDFPFRET